jgi:hypothetical protein
MDFEILSEITEITKIAVGSSIRDIASCEENMEEDAGEN